MEKKDSLMSKVREAAAKCTKAVLGLLGVAVIGCGTSTSCRVMYGCPYSDFEIKGKVVDEQQNPIKGVVVTSYPEYFETGESKIEDITGRYFDAVTAEDGTFVMTVVGVSAPDSLYAVDVDSLENGGHFQTTGVKLELTQTIVPEKDDNDWYGGDFVSQDMLFVMKQKPADVPEEGEDNPEETPEDGVEE